jgi:hypothetical protein
MRYLLLICTDGVPDPEGDRYIQENIDPWVQEMDGRGVRVEGHPLEPISAATTVRVRDEQVVLTDGPFAETKEHIAGFDILECSDLDEAIEVASKHPIARYGTIEVRPFQDI